MWPYPVAHTLYVYVCTCVGSDSEEGHVRSRSSEGGSGECNEYGGYGYVVHVVGMDVAGAEFCEHGKNECVSGEYGNCECVSGKCGNCECGSGECGNGEMCNGECGSSECESVLMKL